MIFHLPQNLSLQVLENKHLPIVCYDLPTSFQTLPLSQRISWMGIFATIAGSLITLCYYLQKLQKIKAEVTVPQEPSWQDKDLVLEAAELCKKSYKEDCNEDIGGYKGAPKWDESSGTLFIAFRGTDPKNFDDILCDVDEQLISREGQGNVKIKH